ncbi:MAG TPA: RHS repeat-associated core domain-containing protein [Syntrophobacteria bacterium]|nr:RHS repeat-associated core domain-containing protein [Syntrophobacteria bacterium]
MCDINVATGAMMHFATDFTLPGFIPLVFQRIYVSTQTDDGPLGHGWRHKYHTRVQVTKTNLIIHNADGSSLSVPLPEPGKLTYIADSHLKIRHEPESILVVTPDSNRQVFTNLHADYQNYPLAFIEDPNGNRITLRYDLRVRLREIIDTVGRRLLFLSDLDGRIKEIQFSGSPNSSSSTRLVSYQYSAAGDLTTVVDRMGHRYDFEYDNHLVTRHSTPLGGIYFFTYDAKKRCLATWRNDQKRIRLLNYDDRDHRILVTDSLGNSTVYQANAAGFVLGETNALGQTKHHYYDEHNNHIMSTDDNDALLGEMTLFDASRNLALVMDAAGAASEYHFDSLNRVTKFVDPLGNVWENQYDERGNLKEAKSPLGARWKFEYDDRGLLVSMSNPLGNTLLETYTSRCQEATLRDDYGLLEHFEYDDYGNRTAMIDGVGNRRVLTYDALGHLTSFVHADGSVCRYQCDAIGDLISYKDENGLETQYRYDAFGNLIAQIDALGRVIQIQYDAEDRLAAILNEKLERMEFGYDRAGNQNRILFFDGRVEHYEYDQRGNVVLIRNSNGQRTHLEYDAVGNLTRKIYWDGSETTFTYDNLGQMLSARNSAGTVEFEYDADGRLIIERQNQHTLAFSYDLMGDRLSLQIDDNRVVANKYDGRGRTVALDDSAGQAYSFTYTPSNFITGIVAVKGPSQFFAFDALDRMIQQRVTLNSRELILRQYEYDPTNKLLRTRDSRRGLYSYNYDRAEQLREVRIGDVISESYDYDVAGNIIGGSVINGVLIGPGNRLMAARGLRFRYNPDGGMDAKQGDLSDTSYKYNPEGSLRSVVDENGGLTEFEYDALGRRIAKIRNSQRIEYLWDDDRLLEERPPEKPIICFAILPGTYAPLGCVSEKGAHFFVCDQLGTPWEVCDEEGNIVWMGEYTAFGELRANPGPFHNPFRFQGQYYDEEIGFCYSYFRYYCPAVGRFTTPDPIHVRSGDINFYRYAPDPINWIDPLGLARTLKIRCKKKYGDKKNREVAAKGRYLQEKANQGELFVRKNCDEKRDKTLRDWYKKNCGPLTANQQPDHKHDLGLGGPDFNEKNGSADCALFKPISNSANLTLGAQIGNQTRRMPANARITSVKLIGCSKY